jgi:hypothetical protein
MDQHFIDRAKAEIRKALDNHPDEGVRAINALVELADDDPAVMRVAAALERKGRK